MIIWALRQIRRGSSGGGGGGERNLGAKNSMHLLFVLHKPVFWTCMNILQVMNIVSVFASGLLWMNISPAAKTSFRSSSLSVCLWGFQHTYKCLCTALYLSTCTYITYACVCRNSLYLESLLQIPPVSFVHWHTLAGLGGGNHHSSESPPSFLTGLESKIKKGRGGVWGRGRSFAFCSWRSS